MSGGKFSPYKAILYSCATILLFVFFFRSLWPEISRSVFEQDLTWYMPNFVWQTQGLSGAALIKFLLSPSLWYMDPVTKSYFWLCHTLFGLQIQYYISLTLLVHLCNAALVFLLCRRARLSFAASYLSALSTFFLFAQFHAYLWPMAFQHIIVVFFMLLGFNLYLNTDERAAEGLPFRGCWLLTLGVNVAASLCRFNIIILPAMMMTHILFCTADDSQKIRKLKLWLPVVAVYLGNPLYSLIGAGDNRAHIDFTRYAYWQVLLPGLLALVICFYLFKGYVRLKQRLPKGFEKYFLMTSAALLAGGVLLVRGSSNSIFAILYSLLIPFIACIKAFFEPLQTAQSALSTFPYYLIPAQASITSYLLAVSCLAYFIAIAYKNHKALLVLFVWYLTCFPFLVHQDPIRGRYFIFLAPIFSIVICTVIVHLADLLFSQVTNMRALWFKKVAIAWVFAILFVTNIAAIKLSLFRGRLVNALNAYDYIKAAALIRDDVHATPEQIFILDLLPAPFPEADYRDITREPTDHYFNGKAVFAQIFKDDRYARVSFQSPPPSAHGPMVYGLTHNRVERNHTPIDPFFNRLDLGKEQLANRQFSKAQASFEQAIQLRPFLFRYLLGGLALNDLQWITNRVSLNDWMEDLKRTNYQQDKGFNPDTQAVLTDIQGEIDAASECLFYLAYLGSLAGDRAMELHWMGQLKNLEDNGDRLQKTLSENPFIASNALLKQYAKGASDFLKYKDWTDWNLYYSFYRFEKFVMRLMGT